MKEARVIILAGQSNAVGVGHAEYLPKHFSPEKVAEFQTGYAKVMINYFSHNKKSGGFVPVTLGCTELVKNTLGPELGMAEYWTAHRPDEEMFIVKCAVGGTSMWRDWMSPSGSDAYDPAARAESPEMAAYSIDHALPMPTGWEYNELCDILRDSLAILEEQGYAPKITGFCWMQGEADACEQGHTDAYEARYHAMISDLKAAFPAYMEDCLFVDAGISEIWPCYVQMNQIKQSYAATHPNCEFLDPIAAGLTTANEPEETVDIYHYDSESVIRLGRMFSEACMKA